MEAVVRNVKTVEVAYADDFEAFGGVLLRSGEPGSRVTQCGQKRTLSTAYVQHLIYTPYRVTDRWEVEREPWLQIMITIKDFQRLPE